MNVITRPLTIRRISGAIGAEIAGTGPLQHASDAMIGQIREIWLEHSAVFFRDQPLAPRDLVGFARRFGKIVKYPFLKPLPDAPEVIVVQKLEHETSNFGGTWHTDTTYLAEPPAATMLIAREIPPQGGDTCFASGYAAYDALSDGMKQLLDPLRGVNSSVLADISRTREDGTNLPYQVFEAEHPVVRTHPETGRKALFVSSSHTSRFAGMTEAESAGLLQFLFAHQARLEFTCRFRWELGSIAFWDNRCALHNPVNDYQGHRRVMHRVTIAGDVPR